MPQINTAECIDAGIIYCGVATPGQGRFKNMPGLLSHVWTVINSFTYAPDINQIYRRLNGWWPSEWPEKRAQGFKQTVTIDALRGIIKQLIELGGALANWWKRNPDGTNAGNTRKTYKAVIPPGDTHENAPCEPNSEITKFGQDTKLLEEKFFFKEEKSFRENCAETESVDNSSPPEPSEKESARPLGGSGRQDEQKQITQKYESKPKVSIHAKNASEGIRDAAIIPEHPPVRKRPGAPDADCAMVCSHPGCNHPLTIDEFTQCQLEAMRFGIRCPEHLQMAMARKASPPLRERYRGVARGVLRKARDFLPAKLKENYDNGQ